MPVSVGYAFLNRTEIGSMNDHVQASKLLLGDGFSLHDIGFRLNQTPLTALTDANGRKYSNPKEVFERLSSDTLRRAPLICLGDVPLPGDHQRMESEVAFSPFDSVYYHQACARWSHHVVIHPDTPFWL